MLNAGLYIHVPFCSKRCPYCAFVLIESDGALHGRFVGAVERHMDRAASEFGRVPFSTLYFGGGTPSLMEPGQILRLIGAARSRFGAVEPLENTLEANPEGLDEVKLRAFREAGVNRLTLGLQSLDDGELKFLGREHDARQGLAAYETARRAGFHNICIDLIFGLPGQSVESWSRTLERAIALGAEHISLYGLTVEKGTELERGVKRGLTLPGDDGQQPLYEVAMALLPREGYRQYELSNFARPGFESRHNSGYWDGRPYLGFGPGAHSYVPHRRWASISNVKEYIDRAERGGDLIGMSEELTLEQRMLERAFLGLRRSQGIFAPAWEEEFGEPLQARFSRAIDPCVEGGLLEWRGAFLVLTPAGRMVADSVVARFA